MHEVSMAFDIVSIAEGYARGHGIAHVAAVHVDVGEYSGIIPESLRLGFSAACERSRLCQGARLELHPKPGLARCLGCGARFHLDAPGQACPACGSHGHEYIAGTEFRITGIGHEAVQ